MTYNVRQVGRVRASAGEFFNWGKCVGVHVRPGYRGFPGYEGVWWLRAMGLAERGKVAGQCEVG